MNEIVIPFLSGAVGGSIVTAIFNYLTMKHKFQISYIKKQIDHFYGPLYIIVSHSSKNFENANMILHAYDKYYSSEEWSQEESTQKILKEESSRTIDISNEYVKAANENNEKIFGIIMNNYSLIDLDDINIVDDYIKNYARLRIEYQGDKNLPFMISRMVGDISFLPSEFKNRVMEKFSAKKTELLNKSSLLKGLKENICFYFKKIKLHCNNHNMKP